MRDPGHGHGGSYVYKVNDNKGSAEGIAHEVVNDLWTDSTGIPASGTGIWLDAKYKWSFSQCREEQRLESEMWL